MKLSRFLAAVVAGTLLSSALVSAADPVKAIMLTQSRTFTHDPVQRNPNNQPKRELAPAEVALIQLGKKTGLFDVVCTQDAAADFTKATLDKVDLVFFYTQGDDIPIADADKDYFFNEWLKKKGHGFIGFHSALDSFKEYQPYWDMIGGSFDGHPWNSGETVTITVHDLNHPAMKPLGSEFQIKDEIYWYRHWQPEKVHVLMSLNLAKCVTKGEMKKAADGKKTDEVAKARHVPVSWVKNYGDGRVFVTNLGHNASTWVDQRFLDHVTGGVKWVLGLEPGDATPNPELSKQQEEKALKDTGLAK